ncbi:MAG: HYR domain-containing protein, partial [Planctomycetota bacterium]
LTPLQGGDTQATATPICALPANLSGTTVGNTDDYNLPADVTNPTLTAACASGTGAGPAGSLPRGAIYTGTGTGPDVVYKIEFPAGNADTLTITMDPTGSQDLSLIVYCNTVSSLLSDGLVADDTGVGGVAESVTVSNIVAGTTLYIVVDGYSTGGVPPGPSGAYTLSITSGGSVQPNCGTPVCDPITCPSNIITTSAVGQCSATVNYTPPTGANCTITCTPPSGSTFNVGTTTVTCANTGGTPSCTFTVTVNDNSPPTIVCPGFQSVNASPGQCGSVVVLQPTVSDNCPGVTVACVPASGSLFPVGVSTVFCTATDASNNTASCFVGVTVIDVTPPVITCPANQTVNGSGPIVVNYPAPTATDNCPGVSVACAPASGSTFAVGTTTVTCTATDATVQPGGGLPPGTAQCSFTVTVVPCSAITCPANVTVSNDSNQCGAVVNYTAPSDANCGTITCAPVTGSFFPKGTTTVTCTSTVGPTCTFTVTVNDTQPPTITCPANIFLGTAGTSATATWTAPTVSDNCPGVAAAVCTPASGSSFNVGVTTVTCTVADAVNNTATCSFNVTVNRVSNSISDPLACTGPGNKVQATLSMSNNGNVNQNVVDTTTFTNLVGVPGSCTISPNVGTCVVTNAGVSYTGTLTPGQTVTITYLTQVSDLATPGSQVCANNSVTFNGGPALAMSACGTVNCPAAGPGLIFPAASEASDQGAGSVLIYNIYTS